MRKLVVLFVLLFSVAGAGAIECGSLPSKINNHSFYAEVISQSHMDLELVVVLKSPYLEGRVQVVGGEDMYGKIPTCDSKSDKPLKWDSERFLSDHTSGGSSSFDAAYRICIYNYKKELVRSYEICNSEVGD